MRDSHDPILTRLFAEHDAALPTEAFVSRLAEQLDRERRKQRVHLVVALFALLAIAVLAAPWLMQLTASISALITEALGSFRPILHSPITWIVGGALAIGLLPSAYVWWAWRRDWSL